jgi:hypothetical protein
VVENSGGGRLGGGASLRAMIGCRHARTRAALALALAMLAGGSSRGQDAETPYPATLKPVQEESAWREGSRVLERWLEVEGLNRSAEDLFPRDIAHDLFNGDEKTATKLRFLYDGVRRYWLGVQTPEGKLYGEIDGGGLGHWRISEELGVGLLGSESDLVTTLRRPKPNALSIRRTYQRWTRFKDEEHEGKKYQPVQLARREGGFEIWWFEAERGVRVMVDEYNSEGKIFARTRYADLRLVDRALEPFETVWGEGAKRTTLRTTRLVNKFQAPAGQFDLPAVQREKWQQSEDILVKYIRACGGEAALGRIVSRVTRSSATNTTGGGTFTMTVSQKAPNFFLVETDAAGLGKSWQGYDGQAGWEYSELQGFRAMRGGEVDLFRRNGLLNVENFRKTYPFRKIVGVKEINGQRAVALELASPAGRAGRHYFDLRSGQLVRVEAELSFGAEGSLPVTMDFSDFRAVDGVTLPFKTVMANPALRIETIVESVEQNRELDDALFRQRKDG